MKTTGTAARNRNGHFGKAGAGDKDFAAVADRSFNFALFDVFNADCFSVSDNYHTGDDRLGFAGSWSWTLGFGDRIAAWSILLRAFRILRERVEPEIENALRAGKSLDHLVDSYRFSQGGHRSEKKNDQSRREHATDSPTCLGVFS